MLCFWGFPLKLLRASCDLHAFLGVPVISSVLSTPPPAPSFSQLAPGTFFYPRLALILSSTPPHIANTVRCPRVLSVPPNVQGPPSSSDTFHLVSFSTKPTCGTSQDPASSQVLRCCSLFSLPAAPFPSVLCHAGLILSLPSQFKFQYI